MVEWKKISDIFDFEKGTLQSSKCTPGEFNFITAAGEWKTHNEYTHDCSALVFAMGASGSLGRTHYVTGKFIASDLCFILTPKNDLKVDSQFYCRLFNFLREDIIKKIATGSSKLAINRTNFANYALPYFDFNHQQLFREKIESIKAIKEDFSDGLSVQLFLLKQMRQTILQDAVEGKLTFEWRKAHPVLISGDNHAARLLEKIKAEKERLVKEGNIKKAKPLPPVSDEETPYELPEGWVWCRLGTLFKQVSTGPFGSMLHKSDYVKNGIPLVNPMNMVDQKICPNEKMMISETTKNRLSRYILAAGDVVIARRGDLSKCAIVRESESGWVCGTGSFFMKLLDPLDKNFFITYFISKHCQGTLQGNSVGQTMDNLNQGLLNRSLFPLPPLDEQQAIVGKVDRLMGMLADLEKQVSARKSQAEQLMQTVLREAFDRG